MCFQNFSDLWFLIKIGTGNLYFLFCYVNKAADEECPSHPQQPCHMELEMALFRFVSISFSSLSPMMNTSTLVGEVIINQKKKHYYE